MRLREEKTLIEKRWDEMKCEWNTSFTVLIFSFALYVDAYVQDIFYQRWWKWNCQVDFHLIAHLMILNELLPTWKDRPTRLFWDVRDAQSVAYGMRIAAGYTHSLSYQR